MSWNNGRIHFREKKSGSKNDAVICAIALHEEPYIDEWIQYHLALGFSHIYLYDNSNDHILKNNHLRSVLRESFVAIKEVSPY